MIRKPAAATLLLAAALGLSPLAIWPATAAADDAPSAALPVRAVTLFSSGVSYTQREGEVNGDATVPLIFRTGQINDILKSLVLLDEKGTVQPAIYAAKDPIGRTLQSFAVDVTQPTSRAELLNRLRGAKVTVESGGIVLAASTMTPRESFTGQIVGVESKEVSLGDGKTSTIDYLTVLADDGLRSVRLDEVRSIRLLDERLNREFHEALSLLAAGSDDRRRQVTLHFDGQGKRRVRVGYIAEAPLWKISYRLLLGGAKPYLQGWALVENTTDEDWNGVRLSLVSGRPVSFIQDLYQPLYLPRPVVPPDVVASPYPQIAEGDLNEERDKKAPAESAGAADRAEAATPPPMAASAPGGFGGGAAFGGLRRAGRSLAVESPAAKALSEEALQASTAAQAQGQKQGELFAYNITTPVTLPRQQAAMIPVVAQDISGEKVSLYNADTDPRFPLSAVRIKNDTSLHLKGGPLTIFDGDTYAGDARMEDIPPGDSRLVTYAVDLDVIGDRQGKGIIQQRMACVIHRGVLTVTRNQREETVYTLKNKADRPRTVLVEHPYTAEYKLVQPAKADERTSDRYRFAVTVPPGKSETLDVIQERPVYQTVGLVGDDLNQISLFVTDGTVPENIKAALREVVTRRRKVQDLRAQADQRDSEIAAITNDQQRIRKNMEALDKQSVLYKRYVGELDQQETRIESLRADAARLRGAASDADQSLRTYLDKLDVQ